MRNLKRTILAAALLIFCGFACLLGAEQPNVDYGLFQIDGELKKKKR